MIYILSYDEGSDRKIVPDEDWEERLDINDRYWGGYEKEEGRGGHKINMKLKKLYNIKIMKI